MVFSLGGDTIGDKGLLIVGTSPREPSSDTNLIVAWAVESMARKKMVRGINRSLVPRDRQCGQPREKAQPKKEAAERARAEAFFVM